MRQSSQIKNAPTPAGESLATDAPSRPAASGGRQRVAALLEAAALAFAQKGYAATTMTEVAARRQLVHWLALPVLSHQGSAGRRPAASADPGAGRQPGQAGVRGGQHEHGGAGHGAVRSAAGFRRTHPSFIKLLDSPAAPEAMTRQVREWMRAQLVQILRLHFGGATTPGLRQHGPGSPRGHQAAAQLWTELNGTARDRALTELRKMLESYLMSFNAPVQRPIGTLTMAFHTQRSPTTVSPRPGPG